MKFEARRPEAVDERLDGQYLADGPLSSYVGADERIAFVLRNKRSGASVEHDGGSETYKPGRPYRTLVAVTDVRLLVAVGGADADGDRVVSIPLSTVTAVGIESGLLGGGLTVRTETGEEWSIPCKGNLDPVVAYLEEAQRAWSQADRSAVDIEDRLETARDHIDSGAYSDALDTAEETISVIADTLARLRDFEIGDGIVANADFEEYRAEIRTIQRRAHAGIASERRAAASDHRAESRLRAVHDDLRRAREAYEQALSIGAERPPDDVIEASIEEIDRELQEVERAPVRAAAEALKEARTVDDPSDRAGQLSVALDRHRDWLGLCWGPDAPFVGDTDAIQAAILGIVDELLDARTSAIQRSLVDADRHQTRDERDEALAACDRASDHLESARDVVTELAPDRTELIETWDATIDEQRARIEGHDRSEPDGTSDADDEKVAGLAMADRATPDATATDEATASEERTDDKPASTEAKLEEMDQAAFTRLVSDAWRALGWETTVFAASVDQYDVMATRELPIALRVIVWTVHRPDGVLDAAVVDRCATDRSNVDRADAAALVTTADVPDDVRDRARDHNVKLLDHERFLDLLEREGLTDLVDETGG
ncbi:MAG: restriction endonuclease [Halapricum sp.]